MAFFGENAVRAWVDLSPQVGVIRDDFNVSSITDNGTGFFTVTYTDNMANELYTTVCNASGAYGATLSGSNYNRTGESAPKSVSQCSVACYAPNNAVLVDVAYCGVIIVGDLS
tara:strand:- start:740 stop:1078 length:339 start_codon:yes stop_codon:yes gene_type:complete